MEIANKKRQFFWSLLTSQVNMSMNLKNGEGASRWERNVTLNALYLQIDLQTRSYDSRGKGPIGWRSERLGCKAAAWNRTHLSLAHIYLPRLENSLLGNCAILDSLSRMILYSNYK